MNYCTVSSVPDENLICPIKIMGDYHFITSKEFAPLLILLQCPHHHYGWFVQVFFLASIQRMIFNC